MTWEILSYEIQIHWITKGLIQLDYKLGTIYCLFTFTYLTLLSQKFKNQFFIVDQLYHFNAINRVFWNSFQGSELVLKYDKVYGTVLSLTYFHSRVHVFDYFDFWFVRIFICFIFLTYDARWLKFYRLTWANAKLLLKWCLYISVSRRSYRLIC